jgi:hypothetical protein
MLASIYAQLGKLPQPVDDTPTDDSDLSFESSEVAADPRTRMALGRFFKRFTTAIANDEFVKELGPTVTVLDLTSAGVCTTSGCVVLGGAVALSSAPPHPARRARRITAATLLLHAAQASAAFSQRRLRR